MKTIGKVTKFSRFTYYGEVVVDDKPIRFHSTSFQGLQQTWPIVGMPVEIVYNKRGALLAVHEIEAS